MGALHLEVRTLWTHVADQRETQEEAHLQVLGRAAMGHRDLRVVREMLGGILDGVLVLRTDHRATDGEDLQAQMVERMGQPQGRGPWQVQDLDRLLDQLTLIQRRDRQVRPREQGHRP